jgi:hypothetical protein
MDAVLYASAKIIVFNKPTQQFEKYANVICGFQSFWELSDFLLPVRFLTHRKTCLKILDLHD